MTRTTDKMPLLANMQVNKLISSIRQDAQQAYGPARHDAQLRWADLGQVASTTVPHVTADDGTLVYLRITLSSGNRGR